MSAPAITKVDEATCRRLVARTGRGVVPAPLALRASLGSALVIAFSEIPRGIVDPRPDVTED